MAFRYDLMAFRYDLMAFRYDLMAFRCDLMERGYAPMENRSQSNCIFVQDAPPYFTLPFCHVNCKV